MLYDTDHKVFFGLEVMIEGTLGEFQGLENIVNAGLVVAFLIK